MIDLGMINSICNHCEQKNEMSLSYFLGIDYKFKKSALVTCRKCNKDYTASIDSQHTE